MMKTVKVRVTIGKANRHFDVECVEANAVELYKEYCEIVKQQAGKRAELNFTIIDDMTRDRETGCQFRVLTVERLEKMIAYRK